MKKLLLTLVALSIPATVFAHERWFVDTANSLGEKPLLFSHWNNVNASFAVIGFFVFVLASVIHIILSTQPASKKITAKLDAWAPWTAPVLRSATGLLLFFASLAGFFFAPDLRSFSPAVPGAFLARGIEMLIGIGLILGFMPRLMSVMGLILYGYVLAAFSFPETLSYLYFVGIFMYLLICGDPTLPKTKKSFFAKTKMIAALHRHVSYALPWLRVILGLSFVFVGIMYKVIQPQYALEFMNTHDINFVTMLGVKDFSNELFILSAGTVEILCGLFIMLGILPRFTALIVTSLMVFTALLFGMKEMFSHLPILAALFAILVNGTGRRLKLFSLPS